MIKIAVSDECMVLRQVSETIVIHTGNAMVSGRRDTVSTEEVNCEYVCSQITELIKIIQKNERKSAPPPIKKQV